MPTIQDLCGWVPNHEAVAQALRELEHPTFSDAAPHLMQDWDGKSDVPLWEIAKKVNNGQNLPADKQTIGDCVSHGHARLVDYMQCIQIALGRSNNVYIEGEHSATSELIYGASREVGGMLGNQDGSNGIWAVKALKNWGFIPRKGKKYDGSYAKEMGRKGLPQEFKEAGKGQVIAQYTQMTNTKEAMNSLVNGYPFTICSNQGFTMSRNQDGIAEAQGSWAHCMLVIGAYMVNGELIFVICQSWGQNTPSGPTVKGMPDNSFGCREKVMSRILNAGDSWAVSNVPGFPSNDINFYV